MRRRVGGIGVVLVALVIAPGCGGGASVPIDQFDTQLFATYCHKIFMCCDAAEIAAIDPTIVDEATCEAVFSANASTNLANDKALVDAGLATYHGDRVRACLDAVSALSCSTWGGPFGNVPLPQCDGLLEGTLPAGSVCGVSAECAGNYCGETSTGGVACAAPVTLGQSCEFAPCVSGLACVSNPSSGGPRTCGHAFPDGSQCIYNPDCTSGLCTADASTGQSVCSPATCNGI